MRTLASEFLACVMVAVAIALYAALLAWLTVLPSIGLLWAIGWLK